MWYSIIVTIVGALAVFLLGRSSSQKKVEKAESREKVADSAQEIARETLKTRAQSDAFIADKKAELDAAAKVGNFNSILQVANELLSVVKEKRDE